MVHLPRPRAVLGPTNTGKTHYAMERMLGHASGMMGFPLRLLARENYDRAVAQKGAAKVALITGEEKIIPPKARYFLCTVEAMPLGLRVDFLAIDEVQLAADPERGHVFTDRILNARGAEETLLLGAETIRRPLMALLPDIKIETRTRLSRLSWSGQKKITRLPRRSAVVAFSIPEVIRLAELIRTRRGGTALIMGALSPRTRNAQVELYQSGAVDYMVATDAIGMGLNMDIQHIALAGAVKFDGYRPRVLTPAELAQVAGRAGRHTTDGTFGTTETCGMLDEEVIAAIENHRFEPLPGVFYRNSRLDYSSPDALLASLEAKPPLPMMTRKADADDHKALADLCERDEIRAQAHGAEAVRLLYDVCQIPDYQRDYSDSHSTLLAQIYTHLVAGDCLPPDWVAAAMKRHDRSHGDMDTLMMRLASIRTWCYISQRTGWLDDAEGLQRLARSIEDRVSDSLNQVLTQRFVDRRAAVLAKGLAGNKALMSVIKNDGSVLVEGEEVGRLEGFVFTPEVSDSDENAATSTPGSTTVSTPVMAAVRKALSAEIARRARALCASADEAFRPDQHGVIYWREAAIGRLIKGDHLYQPKAEVYSSGGYASGLLEGAALKAVQDRLNGFAASWPKMVLAKAVALTGDEAAARSTAPHITGPARGIAYSLYESLGTIPREKVAGMVRALDEAGKQYLARHGVRLGVDMIYMADLLKPPQVAARALLYSLDKGVFPDSGPPPPGRVAVERAEGVSDDYWLAVGYRPLGELVMRVDIAERLAAVVRVAARQGGFTISEEMLSLAGTTRERMEAILADLGYRRVGAQPEGDDSKPPLVLYTRRPPRPPRPPRRRKAAGKTASKAAGKSASPSAKQKKQAQPKRVGRKQEGRKQEGRKAAKPSSTRHQSARHKSGRLQSGRPKSADKRPKQEAPINPHSPFAILARLKPGVRPDNG